MDKVRIIKLMRRKVYWERERDKCFFNIFFFWIFLTGFSFKAKNYSGIKKVKEIGGWSNANRGDKFNYVFDWISIIILVIYLVFAIYYLTRIQICSQKLVDINQQLLKELNPS